MSQEQSVISNINESIQKGYENVKSTYESAKEGVSNTINSVTDNKGSPSFMESNTLVAKFSFIIMIVIVFIILFRIGLALILYFTRPSTSPYIVKGLLNGGEKHTISQDPNIDGSVTVLRSNNESKGAEFSWSVWLYITNIEGDQYKNIFNKGSKDYDVTTGIAKTNNAPGLYLGGPKKNALKIKMDSVKGGDVATEIEIDNIPLKKWVHVVIRLQNNILDVYVNGTIADRLILHHTPKQNYDDVHVNQGEFPGQMSDLRYFSRALNVFEINSILNNGPDLTSSSLSAVSGAGFYGYLSNMWYTSKV
jgi:hypothetical protein